MKKLYTALSAREEYLAANPEARKMQDASLAQITAVVGNFRHKFKNAINEFVDTAEQARQIGIAIIEFEETLPGKKMTADFWNQLESLFVDNYGNPITKEMLEWFVKIARGNTNPIDNILTALQWRQPLLLATGDEEFSLIGERAPQHRIAPQDEWNTLASWLDEMDVPEKVEKLLNNPHYFVDGQLRPEMRDCIDEDWKKTFDAVDLLRSKIGI